MLNEQQKAFVAQFLGKGLLSKKKNKKIEANYEGYLTQEALFKTLATQIRKDHPDMQALILRLQQVMEDKNRGDFTTATTSMAQLVLEAQALKPRVAYEDALALIQADIDEAQLIDADGQTALNTAKTNFQDLHEAMIKLAEASDFDGAEAAVEGVGKAAKTAIDMAKAYKPHKKALAKVQSDIEAAGKVDTASQLALETALRTFQSLQGDMAKLVTAGDFSGALALVQGVGDAAKKLVELEGKFTTCKTLLYKTGTKDREYLAQLMRNGIPSDKTRDALYAYTDMMRLYHQGQYDQCTTDFKKLQQDIAELKKAVKESDKLAKPKAKASMEKFEKLAGDKKLSKLSTKQMTALVDELKKLPLSEQTDMLAGLHGTSEPLDAEGRLMQIAMYHAMKLDTAFEKDDEKKRKAYRDELTKDEEIQDTVSDWNAKTKDGQPVVSIDQQKAVLEKILKTQSKQYDIPVPAIRWYDGGKGDFGGFNTTSGIISLNTRYLSDPEEMINTILHENTHNYQDQLAQRYFKGEIKESDPVYEQAKAFALTHHMDAYVPSKEDKLAYKVQPEEMHAWGAGDTEAPKLMKELGKAKAKRNQKSQKK